MTPNDQFHCGCCRVIPGTRADLILLKKFATIECPPLRHQYQPQHQERYLPIKISPSDRSESHHNSHHSKTSTTSRNSHCEILTQKWLRIGMKAASRISHLFQKPQRYLNSLLPTDSRTTTACRSDLAEDAVMLFFGGHRHDEFLTWQEAQPDIDPSQYDKLPTEDQLIRFFILKNRGTYSFPLRFRPLLYLGDRLRLRLQSTANISSTRTRLSKSL
ncbi:hypothetical protein K469DRAFT_319347 [Zopfia rhizophila CBS 207.26]|uniref:Uncharacterized protein n=1 Tax=Zopfia rhizophila CBS 207.26 TaxID=1314779 RepID=A0A6A6EP43_9PEZI|nr:hypothetical protein K469DRAFT_319347 [Zopfia rhizophila CBS 207.26]